MTLPRRFYYLDALRGLAALAVVLTHWKHFGLLVPTGTFVEARVPFYQMLKPFYEDGGRAVDLFFCLSGFIFYWLYAEKVSGRKISWRKFFVLRFSRLYPLHFATLLFVAAGQQLYLHRTGAYFCYAFNSYRDFLLQLAFASNWVTGDRLSFNGPVWSVSVEVLLYVMFFAVCIVQLRRWWHLSLFVLLGFALHRTSLVDRFGQGVIYFFLGGLVFYGVSNAVRKGVSGNAIRALAVVTAVLWFAGVIAVYVPVHCPLIFEAVFVPLLFSLTIMSLALLESSASRTEKRLEILGEISYSSYLLHFPLQLFFAIISVGWTLPSSLCYSGWTLFLFFGALLPLSFCSYRFFEKPLQDFLRERLL